MKKIGILILICSLLFSLAPVVSAEKIDNTELNTNQKNQLYKMLGYDSKDVTFINEKKIDKLNIENVNNLNLTPEEILKAIEYGFSKQAISDFTQQDLDYLKSKEPSLISVQEKYISMDSTGKTQEVPKALALASIQTQKNKSLNNQKSLSNIGSDAEELSWMIAYTAVSKDTSVYPTQYHILHEFLWTSEPFWTLQDVVGISHSTNLIQVQDSEYFKHTYDYHVENFLQPYAGTHSNYYFTADKKNATAMAFKFNLKFYHWIGQTKYVAKRDRGYMSFSVTKNSGSSASAYGHYIHTQIAAIPSIGINLSPGSITITGAVTYKNMRDTHVTFNF